MKTGIIRGVVSAGGFLLLRLEDPNTGRTEVVPGDNGPTVRALMNMFGPQIVQGHAVIMEELLGKTIEYTMTDWDTLESISEP